MTMTVSRLHKQLSELIAAGHGRKPEFIGTTDDDGGTKFNRDGTEAGRYTVVLSGEEEE